MAIGAIGLIVLVILIVCLAVIFMGKKDDKRN